MDYYSGSYIEPQPASEETKKFASQILIWKKTRQTFYANDILNMLIDANLININEIISMAEEINNKEVKAELPNSHILV